MENEEEITIEDDLGFDRFGKVLVIRKTDVGIQLSFMYEEKENLNEFGVYIINVAYDGRSRVDQQGKDTKKRLFELCKTLLSTFKQYEDSYDGKRLQKKIEKE